MLADVWPSPRRSGESSARPSTRPCSGDVRGRLRGRPPLEGAADPRRATATTWDDASTYIAKPPFFEGLSAAIPPVADIDGARVLAVLGDSVTTDHISPAGSIAPWSPAGQWLQAHGVPPLEFNSYGARRGHHEVMMRGTFANIRLRNRLTPEREGAVHGPPARRRAGIHLRRGDAVSRRRRPADRHRRPRVRQRLVARLGREGPDAPRRPGRHRGVLRADPPLQPRRDGRAAAAVPARRERARHSASRGASRTRSTVSPTGPRPRGRLTVIARSDETGDDRRFDVISRLDGPIEVDYYRNGGILPAVLRRLARESAAVH